MRTKRNWLRTTIAMLTLVATVLETGFSSVQTFAAEITTEDGIVVNTDAVDEASQDAESGDDLQIDVVRDENGSEEASAEEDASKESVESEEDTAVEEAGSTEEDAAAEEPAVEEETFEEAEELKEGNLDIYDDEIRGFGYDEISIYVDTEKLAKKDRFRIEFTGPADASYNPVINEDLDKTNDGRYDFEYLDGGEFSIRITSSDDVILSCKYNEDGYPTFALESVRAEKSLDTDTITASDDTEAAAIKGEGYDSITIKFATEDLSDKAAFKLYVESDAKATADGEDATKGITGLDKDTDSLTVEDLDGESFIAYVISDNEEVKIKTLADVDSVEDGVAVITVDNENVKRVYEYEDSKIKVTATLEKADAVPDDAYFDVTPLTEEEAQAYLEAANANLEEDQTPYTEENSLLYNIGFYTDESKSEELEPEEGSVKINIEFKKEQLTEEIEAVDDESVEVVHFTEEGKEIIPEVVEANVSVEDGTADFELESFSVVLLKAINDVKPGTKRDVANILGSALYYGVSANEVTLGAHMDTNFAVGKLNASCNTTQGAYTGSGNPGNDIIADYTGSGWYADVSSGKRYIIETTPDVYKKVTNNGTNTNYTSRSYITFDTNHTKDELLTKVSGIVSGTASEALKNEEKQYNFRSAATHATPGNDSTPWLLDLSSRPAGTYYFTFNDAYSNYTNNGGPMKIKLKQDQIVVFNVPGKTVELQQFEIDLGNGFKASSMQNADADEYCQHVVWNLYEATTASNQGSVLGMVLCPKATYSVGGTSTGWLIANHVKNGGEWHMVWQDMPETEGISTQFFAKKTVNNNPPAADEVFSFELYTYDFGSKTYSASPIQTVQNAGELITFKPIEYSYDEVKNAEGEKKTYGYKIVEKVTDKQGYTIDSTQYVIHVKVKVDGQNLKIYEKSVYKDGGKTWISSDYTQSGTAVRFNNTHITKEENDTANYTLKIKKTLKDKQTGKEVKYWPTTFKFKVYPEYKDSITPVDKHMPVPSPNPKEIIISSGNDNVRDVLTININAKEFFNHLDPNSHDGYFTRHINWNLPGGGVEEIRGSNYKYRIEEIKVNNDGIEYGEPLVRYMKLLIDVSKVTKDGKVTYSIVTDNNTDSKNFGLKIRPKYSINNQNCVEWGNEPAEFVNQYEAEGSTKIYGQKVLDNVQYKAGDFTFVLKDSTGKTLETVTNDANGKINFKHEFKYTLADMDDQKTKVFTYTIEEDESKSKIQGVKCVSDNPITFDITVTNNGTIKNGKRVLDITNPYCSDKKPFKFINTKTVDGDVQFFVKKVNTGNHSELTNKKFKFTLKGLGTDSDVSQTVENVGVNETRQFDKIDYKSISSNEVAVHKYQITEVNDNQAGVVYDGRKYDIEVRVSLDKATGTFKKEIYAGYDGKLEKKNEGFVITAEFDNGYDLKETTDDVDGEKTLHGKDLEAGEFTFKIEPGDDATKEAVNPTEEGKTAVVVMPEKSEVPNLADGSFKFEKITFKKAGTYVFKVTEIPNADSKYVNDASEYFVTIPVDDVGGQLTVDKTKKTITKDGTIVKAIAFDNTYNGEGEITLYARKNFSGRTLKDGEFTFTLESHDGVNKNQTVTNNGATVSFETLKYTTAMMVEDGKKVKEKKFTYNIKETVPADAKKQENIKKIGDETYYTLNGVYYDQNAEADHVVTVTVTQNADGTLTAVADKHASEAAASEVEFRNFYRSEGKFDIVGSKVITGRKFISNDKEKDSFTFKLTGPEGSGVEREVTIKPENGTSQLEWAFSDITLDQDNYTKYAGVYTVEELDGGGVIVDGKELKNDDTLYHVLVTLTDDGKGNITHNEIYYKDNPESPISGIVFKNEYEAEGAVYLEAHKELKKGKIGPKMFRFFLKDENGDVIDEKYNGQGADKEEISAELAIFKKLNYTLDQLEKNEDGTYKPRTFTYTIGEYEGNDEYITYNVEKELYTAEVTVSDDGTGILHTETVYKNEAKSAVDEAKFINEYKAYGEEEIYARKILEGRTLRDNDFTFILTDEAGNTKTAKVADSNGKEGKATFEKIVFTQDDLDPKNEKFKLNHATDKDGVYARYYTLREDIPAGSTRFTETDAEGKVHVFWKSTDGYVYDGTVYSVIVTIKDLKNGKIDTDWVAYPEGDVQPEDLKWYETLLDTVKGWFGADATNHKAVFTNKYKASAGLKLKVTKNLVGEGWNKADDDFSFTLSGKTEAGDKFSESKSIKLVRDAVGNIVTPHEYDVVSFENIIYTKPGEYEYIIKENDPGKDYINWDGTEHKVNVTVSEAKDTEGNNIYDGKLVVSATIDGAAATCTVDTEAGVKDADNNPVELYVPTSVIITNTYNVLPVALQLGGTKTLSNYDLKEAASFSFKIEQMTDNTYATAVAGGYTDTQTSVRNADGTFPPFWFAPIKYDLEKLSNGDGTYKRSEVFYYLVSETEPADGKVKDVVYDKTDYKVAVEVTNSGNGILSARILRNDLEVAVVNSNDSTEENPKQFSVAQFDNKGVTPGKIQFSVKKDVVNSQNADTTFNFTLAGDGLTTPLQAQAVNKAEGKFAEIPYNYDEIVAAGGKKEYKYTITEDDPVSDAKGEVTTDPDTGLLVKNGISYTKDKYEITVTVEVDSNDKTKLNVSDSVKKFKWEKGSYSEDTSFVNDASGLTLTFPFENSYDAEGDTTIEGFKVISGVENAPVSGFQFKITRTDANGSEVAFEEGEVAHTVVTSAANGKFCFDMHYTLDSLKEPVRYYVIEEDYDDATKAALNEEYQKIYGPDAFLDFSTQKFNVVVRLTDNGNGTIKADRTDDIKEIKIDNPVVLPNSIQFVAVKTLTGRPLKGDWFRFTLKKTGDNGYEKSGVVVVREDGQTADITFPAETFTLNDAGKTYNYEIIEEDYSKIAGVKRVVTSYKAEVKITRDGNTIKVNKDDVTVTCDKPDEDSLKGNVAVLTESTEKAGAYTIGGIKFKNEYSSEVEVSLKGEKHISGFDENNKDIDFTFALYDFGNQTTPLKINKDGKVAEDGDEQQFTVNPSKGKDLTFDFATLKYDEKDAGQTFHYVIKEVVPETKAENVSYSTIWYDVTVKVDYAENDGPLTATVTQKKMDGTNTTPLSTSEYTTSYDEDKNLGTLEIAGFDFTNRYLHNEIAFAAIKDLAGRALGDEKTYSFKLTDKFNNTVVPKESDKSGEAAFDPIPYGEGDLGKDHEYIIEENEPKDGSKLDETVAKSYRIVVTPYEDANDGGKLKYTKTVYKTYNDGNSYKELDVTGEYPDGTEVFNFTFHNDYNMEASVPVPVKKILVNKALDPSKDQFRFILRDASGAKIKVKKGEGESAAIEEKDYLEVSNKTVAALGERKDITIGDVTKSRRFAESEVFYFDPIYYNSIDVLGNQDEVKKYYTVVEEPTEEQLKSYIDYAKTEYVVEVTIKAENDKLTAEVTGISGSDDIKADAAKKNALIEWFKSFTSADARNNEYKTREECEFINIYKAECTIDPPVLRKAIMGRDIVPGDFKFEITGPALDSNEKYKNGYHSVVQNGIKDDGTLLDNPGEIYVGDVSYKLSWEYDDLQFGDKLSDEDKAWVGADADKYVKFVYTAKEVEGEDTTGFKYSDVELSLTVFVMDDGEGNLIVKGLGNKDPWNKDTNPKALEWKQTKGSNIVDVEANVEETDENGNKVVTKKKIDIVNIFNQKGHIDLEGKKLYNGPDFDADKFSFAITEVNDPVERKAISKSYTVKNSGNGTIGSDPDLVKFDHSQIDILNYSAGAEYDKDTNTYTAKPLDGVVGPHFYLIEETAQTDENIDYDYNKYIVTVDVSETYRNENGKKVYETRNNGVPVLKAEVSNVQVLVPGSERLVGFDEYSRTGTVETGFTYHTAFKFENKREAYGNVSISGIKFLTDLAGNTPASPNALKDQFGFAIHQYDDAARTKGKTLIDSTRSEADGSFNLNVIKEGKNYAYDLNDLKDEKGVAQTSRTFYYRVTETKPSSGVWSENNTVFESEGIIYDLVEYDVDVKVTFDGTKALKVEKTIRNAATGEAVASKYTSRGKDLGFSNTVKEYTVIEGNKYWIDNFTDPSQRPTITVNLYQRTASGVERKINSYDIVAPDTTYRFATDASGNKLPTYDSAGRPYTYIVEETPIEGYLSEKINYDFYNTAGDILIRKIDADTRAPLSGAVLAIFDGSTEIERWTSGTSAHVIESALTAGKTYTLREITAPEGYGVAEDMTFTVPADGSSITVTMSDPPIIGSVRLTKRDASTRETLAGAEFALYNDAGTRIYATGTPGSYRATSTTSNGVFVTDGSGSLTIADLPYGTYYFVETKAPDGYALSTERLGFTILRSGELVEVTYLDSKAVGSVRLRKVGARGTIGLAGAVFELYARTPRTVGQAAASTLFSDAYYRYGTYRTNAAGEIYVGDLPWDDYYFVEVDAPAGYEVATDVNGDDLVYVFTVGAGTADLTIDLGGIVNNPTEETPPPRGGVLGARVKRGGVVNGVLGVRAKPSSGVLGVRVGPVTGDASNIILWLLLLTACVATIVATIVTGRKKKTATK